MAQLNQLIAVRNDVGNRQNRVVTDFYHGVQKSEPFNGMVRNYQPFVDAPENMVPSESVLVRNQVNKVLAGVNEAMARMWDLNASIDVTNTVAMAAVVLEDGTTLTGLLPATHLLFLEKQLVDVRTIISKLPVLDPAFVWTFEDQTGLWSTEELKGLRTKKEKKVLVAYAATDKHPAQVATYDEDTPVGTWTTRKLSGAVPATTVAKMLARVDTVLMAVKKAREAANQTSVVDAQSSPILEFIFQA